MTLAIKSSLPFNPPTGGVPNPQPLSAAGQPKSRPRPHCRLNGFSATRPSNPSTRSNGKGAPPKSPTTPARSFSSRKTSKCPSPGRVLATKVVVSKYFYGEQNTARTGNLRPPAHPSRLPHHRRLGRARTAISTRPDGEVFYDELTWLCLNQYGAFNSPGLVQRRPLPSIRRRQALRAAATGSTTARPARPSAPAPSTNIPRAAPASSSPSTTTWRASCTWPTARPCSSNTAPAPAPTSPPSAPAAKNSAAAAGPAARSPSSRSMTRSPTSSNPAAKPAAPPR